jgi:hypothetical protein
MTDHERMATTPDFQTYLSSRARVPSVLSMLECVVMLVEEISKVQGTCPEDCQLYRVLHGQIAAVEGR